MADDRDTKTETSIEPSTADLDGARVLIFWPQGTLARPLPPEGRLTIGRGEGCDLRVAHPSVSRKHALLHVNPLRIEDLGSANGTRVAGRRLAPGETADLAPDQTVEFGSAIILVVQDARRARPGEASPPGDPMDAVRRLVELVAKGTISVLVLGETGVGKEVTTELIHSLSPRAKMPLVRINCAALTESLLESELFGHERGAFTGATHAKPGLLETANGGTFFFDEVGELPLATQTKLLRVLESREVLRVGGLQPRPLDVRFVSATNRNLREMCASRLFREDLYFRLNGITVTVPPLRGRAAEIRRLTEQFLAESCAAAGKSGVTLTRGALQELDRYDWPGNVRQLRHVVERAVLLCTNDRIDAQHLALEGSALPALGGSPSAGAPSASRPSGDLRKDLDELERERIVAALAQCAGNQTHAARLLGISRRTLIVRLDAYALPRPRK